MALSFVTYTGNGSNRIFNLTFTYLQQADVSVKVNNVAVTFIFLDSARVQTTVAPASGAIVEVRRTSSRTARVVDFQDGAVLTEAALDGDSNQLFQLTQEAFDASDTALPLAFDQTYDATTKRIKNVADPTSAQDAATKNWVETASTSQVSIATTKAAEASSSATSALASKNAAAASLVLTNQDVVLTHADVVLAEADKVQTGVDRAAVAADLVLTNADVVLAEADKVQTALDRIDVTAKASATTTNATNASTSANNAAASLTSFNGKYVSQANAPASPSTGLLWFDTSASTMKVYNGSAFANAGSSVNGVQNSVQHTATAGQTSFAATYDAGFVQVYLNGIRLDTADYTATNGSAVVLAVAASVGDVVFIHAFGTFAIADVYTKTASDARFKPIGASSGGPSLGTASVIRTNAAVISESITINTNGMSAGPITIADGHTITIGNSGNWSIV
tara:strand:+ start:2484 stop:3839 length:1356 start_codon:yes stop_codon:yes gene_type:complete